MRSCAEIAALLEPFLALELTPEVEAEVRAHVARCPACRAAVDEAEPATGIALRLAGAPSDDGEEFVAAVLAGVHQHRLERRLRRRRLRWAGVAAALLVAVLAGYFGGRGERSAPEAVVAELPAGEGDDDLPFVEVEGDGVTVYELTSASRDTVQVALIIDPRLQL